MEKFVKKLLVPLLFLVLSSCGENPENSVPPTAAVEESGVTMIVNAHIHTFDQGFTSMTPGAMAFDRAGTIVAIGENDPMLAEYPDARVIDLEGKTVLPGLIDSHGHLYGLAVSFTRANLAGTRSKAEVIERLRQFATDLPAGEWLLGRGWDQNDWPEQAFPNSADLDAAFPGRPVWLRRIDGHAAWANSAAIAQADSDLGGDW